MKTVLFLILGISTTALAHVEPGVYQGKDSSGAACEMKVIETFFEGGMPHPLNERVRIQINGDEFLVGHPSVIDEAKSQVVFNHDRFQGVLAQKGGAKALIVGMSHATGSEGPTDFTVINHIWKAGDGSSVRCLGLVKI